MPRKAGSNSRCPFYRGSSLLKVSFKREWTVHLQVDGRNGFYGVLLDLHNLSGHMKPKSNNCLLFNVA